MSYRQSPNKQKVESYYEKKNVRDNKFNDLLGMSKNQKKEPFIDPSSKFIRIGDTAKTESSGIIDHMWTRNQTTQETEEQPVETDRMLVETKLLSDHLQAGSDLELQKEPQIRVEHNEEQPAIETQVIDQ